MLDRFKSLEIFGKVVALGSFSAAARATGLSQAMVTKHIASLEHRLGARLFHRTTRRISITEAGSAYFEATSRILADLELADSAISSTRVEPRGKLRVAAPQSFGTLHLAPLLSAFAETYPEISLELGLNERVVDLVQEGWDVAIRIGQLKDSSLVATRLAPCRMTVCAAQAYLDAFSQPRKVAELAAHNCLVYTLSNDIGPKQWTFGQRREVQVRVSGNVSASSGEALRIAALSGLGIAYLPTFIVGPDIAAGRLIALELDHPTIELGGIHAVYPSNRATPAKLKAFLEFLSGRFSPVPPWDQD